jgi:hypothetical protein
LKEASDSGAALVVILESAVLATVKQLATGEQRQGSLEGLPQTLRALIPNR